MLTKADIATAEKVERQLQSARKLADFDDEVVVSAVEGFNVDGFVETVVRLLPQGPRYFPRDMRTDQPLEVMIAEFIREKVLRSTFEEVPHAVGVVVDELEWDDRPTWPGSAPSSTWNGTPRRASSSVRAAR